jgi:Protein of unknown function (DUF2946)
VITLRRLSHPLIWLLLVAAVMMRAAMPAGWMPTVDQSGIRIAVCTGMGPEFLTMGSDGNLHKEAPAPRAPHEPCPFALAAAAPAYLPPALVLPQPPVSLIPLAFPELAAISAALRRNPRPPARGPPALA